MALVAISPMFMSSGLNPQRKGQFVFLVFAGGRDDILGAVFCLSVRIITSIFYLPRRL